MMTNNLDTRVVIKLFEHDLLALRVRCVSEGMEIYLKGE